MRSTGRVQQLRPACCACEVTSTVQRRQAVPLGLRRPIVFCCTPGRFFLTMSRCPTQTTAARPHLTASKSAERNTVHGKEGSIFPRRQSSGVGSCRLAANPPRSPAPLRHQAFPARPARGPHRRFRRPRLPCPDAHRRRQIAHLPAARVLPAQTRRRRIPAHRPHAGPASQGCARRDHLRKSELHPQARRSSARRAPDRRAHRATHLRHARAPAE